MGDNDFILTNKFKLVPSVQPLGNSFFTFHVKVIIFKAGVVNDSIINHIIYLTNGKIVFAIVITNTSNPAVLNFQHNNFFLSKYQSQSGCIINSFLSSNKEMNTRRAFIPSICIKIRNFDRFSNGINKF